MGKLQPRKLNISDAEALSFINSRLEATDLQSPPKGKFREDFVPVAARLKAAGFSDDDLAYSFGVTHDTIEKWKKKYPTFKAVCNNGKQMAARYLVAQGLKAAAGYEYEETQTEYMQKMVDNKIVELPGKTRVTKKFLSGGEYKYIKNVEVNENKTTLNVDLQAKLETDEIKRLAGRLTKRIECSERE
jgi:hypothetical protein